MSVPTELLYTKDHEWLKQTNTMAVVGITDHAQEALGDVVFVELPEVGKLVQAGQAFGTVESVKAVSDLFAPVSGEIVAVNVELKDHPEWVNQACYDKAWMIKLRPTNQAEFTTLLDAKAYQALLG